RTADAAVGFAAGAGLECRARCDRVGVVAVDRRIGAGGSGVDRWNHTDGLSAEADYLSRTNIHGDEWRVATRATSIFPEAGKALGADNRKSERPTGSGKRRRPVETMRRRSSAEIAFRLKQEARNLVLLARPPKLPRGADPRAPFPDPVPIVAA